MPLQTADNFTINREFGRFEGLSVYVIELQRSERHESSDPTSAVRASSMISAAINRDLPAPCI